MKGKALAFSLVLAIQGAPAAHAVNLSMVSGATGGDAQFVCRPGMRLSKAPGTADPPHVRRLSDSGARRFTPSGVRFALAESHNHDLVAPRRPTPQFGQQRVPSGPRCVSGGQSRTI